MDFEELKRMAEELANEAVQGTTVHKPEEAGLDRRACCELYRGLDFLAIAKHDLNAMRYYGGFEYVDQLHVMDMGAYVFYSTEDARVENHWGQCEPEVEPELCTACNGSGEGQYDGTRCSYCGGSGSIKQGED